MNNHSTTEFTSPKFTASKLEMKLIVKAAKRAVAMAENHGWRDYDRMTAIMDLEACHCNGTPLDLDKLNAADDFNFAHDVFGIANHIDRKTGKLINCFSPRCSLLAPCAL